MEESKLALNGLDPLVSEIPNLMGFVPADSLVLVGLLDLGTRSKVEVTLRIDLPAPEHRAPAARFLRQFAEDKEVDAVVAVVIGGDREEQRELIAEVGSEFDEHEISVHAVWTAALRDGENWYCYQHDGCDGVVYDTTGSQLAAMAAAGGFRLWGSREEMAATIAPASDAVRRDVADRLQTWYERSEDVPQSLREAAAPVFAALERLRDGEALSTDEAVAALGAVGSPAVRDLMLFRREPGAEQLWTILLRHAPDTEVEAPAVLLAVASHLIGDGVMANLALERARKAAAPQAPSVLLSMLEQILMAKAHHLSALLDNMAGDPEIQLD
ncbi:DUF4192 domain-containing protein [Saccharopolyspora sp. 6V]|uniref:DUF4192 domain-containing protein n=1 Tax=Saccharopolyspora sp. 6V TaxID=2877239 RepID=UPI001CD47399|nr:DUF4192 domain-containing protein [Saccharopolyspora sp. 6V]MCA1196246.1 DUF4192 domain-containing protein [Saccharopolyspora sp. 6V]